MRTLVTGGTGFIGRRLVTRLVHEGHGVCVLSRHSPQQSLFNGLPLTFYPADLGDKASLDLAMRGIEQVFHCAVTRSGNWGEFYRGTVLGTRDLLEASIRAKVKKFVYISSISVYRSSSFRRDLTVDESFPLEDHPESRDPYSRAKLLAERIAQEILKREELPLCILRPGLVYGPGWKWSRLDIGIPFGRRFLILIGNGGHRLPLVHVEDLVEAILLAGRSPSSLNGIFNVVGSDSPTNARFLNLFEEIAGDARFKIRIPLMLGLAGAFILEKSAVLPKLGISTSISVSQFLPIWRSVLFDSSRIREELGWLPRVSLEEGLRLALG